jgi:7-keto-8-aminopelargonate synthetase-like enzyme
MARPELRDAIRRNSDQLYQGFKGLGLELCCDTVSPVVAVKVADEPTAIRMWNALVNGGVYVNIALPPGTPNGTCLLRCSVSAAHTPEEISRVIDIFADVVAPGRSAVAAAG